MSKLLTNLVVSAVVAIGASYATVRWLAPTSTPHTLTRTENVPKAKPALEQVVALGTIVPGGGLIDLGGPPGDRLASFAPGVAEGKMVTAGQVLATLESHSLREMEKKAADVAIDEAKKRQELEHEYGSMLISEVPAHDQELAQQDSEVKALEERLAAARASFDAAKADRDRMAGLEASVVSTQQRQHQELLLKQAQADVDSAEAQLAKLKMARDFSKSHPNHKQRLAELGRDRLTSALQMATLKANQALADARLSASQVRAPCDGQILQILLQVGESVGQTPILRMGNTKQMEVVAEVYESQAHLVQADQTVSITSDALSEPLTGKVTEVGVVVAKNEVLSLDPLKVADLRVVQVRVLLDEKSCARAARLINLQVTAHISTDSSADAGKSEPPAPVGELAK